jgi:RHS repeat-associated protein
LYDEGGQIAGVNYKGRDFYYKKNLQGDVIAIVDTDGRTICTYIYDAWGNHKVCLSEDCLHSGGTYFAGYCGCYPQELGEVECTCGSKGNSHGLDCAVTINKINYEIPYVNPIRYRGYYYDVETGLYYLNSRYYDPDTGRFINADIPEILKLSQDVARYNLFTYCHNDPVNYVDPFGLSETEATIFGMAAIGGLINAASIFFGVIGIIKPPGPIRIMMAFLIAFAGFMISSAQYVYVIKALDERLLRNGSSWRGEYNRRMEKAENFFVIATVAAIITFICTAIGLKFERLHWVMSLFLTIVGILGIVVSVKFLALDIITIVTEMITKKFNWVARVLN